MNQDRIVREQLQSLLDGGNSHMEFAEVIAEFPIEHINSKAPGVPYSPWHFLEHMRIAQWDILEFIRNPDHVSPDYPEGYRPRADQQADEAQWNQTVLDFANDLKALQDLVADPDTDLFAPLPHAPKYTIFREILVAADHNSYHLGELALLRQVMDLWPEGNRYLTG
ncbi:MAG: DinB family protein [Desulfobulbaceae bacterium]|nr:DinB family protein [Desulfobulbaceae bacterium]